MDAQLPSATGSNLLFYRQNFLYTVLYKLCFSAFVECSGKDNFDSLNFVSLNLTSRKSRGRWVLELEYGLNVLLTFVTIILQGKYYAVNIPLRDGMDDESYESIFVPIISKVMETFQPSAVVLQCGADSLTGNQNSNMDTNEKIKKIYISDTI